MKALTLFLVTFVSLQAGAAEIEDPWALLPALPSACYTEEDTFSDQAFAVIETFATEAARQEEINQELSQQLANLDPMEYQQRMMDFMTQNPQEAQKYMESMASAGAEVNELMPKMQEETFALHSERDNLHAEYDGAVKALDDAYSKGTEALFADSKNFDSDLATYHAAVDALNGGYQKLCASWWKNGRYHDWLARHEDLQRRTVALEVDIDVLVQNYTVFGIDAANYRSTSALNAAKRQLDAAEQIFRRRKNKPMPKDDFIPGGG